ncbi:MAG: hypothetical protein KAX49_03030 [Halanaerobiales bacterium]|nr:hypothetical protein [Halanaerobiales bacterium]
MQILWLIIGLIILGLLVFMITIRKKTKQEPDYRTFFIIGASWIPLGVATKNYVFSVMGIILLAVGLKNKDKWSNVKKWSELSLEVKRIKLAVVIFLSLVLVVGIVLYVLNRG